MKSRTSKTKKTKVDQSGCVPKIKKTLNKKSSLKSGLSTKEMIQNLDTNISIAKGMLATLSLGHPSLWTRKLQKTDKEHLRILLQDVMEEIWSAEMTLMNLQQKLSKSYMGICLL